MVSRRLVGGVTQEYAAKMIEKGFGAFPPDERVGIGMSLFVLAVDGLGWSDARIIAHVKKGLNERRSTLEKLRQEGKFPKEVPDPVESAWAQSLADLVETHEAWPVNTPSSEPPTLDESPDALKATHVKGPVCVWCFTGEDHPIHSREAHPNTWHPFRPGTKG